MTTREKVKTNGIEISEKHLRRASEKFDIPVELFRQAAGVYEGEPQSPLEKAKRDYQYAQTNTQQEKEAYNRWDNIALQNIQKAQTIKEVRCLLPLIPNSGKSQQAAFKKWDELSSQEIKAVVEKKDTKKAEAKKDLTRAYERTRRGSRAEKEALLEMINFD